MAEFLFSGRGSHRVFSERAGIYRPAELSGSQRGQREQNTEPVPKHSAPLLTDHKLTLRAKVCNAADE